MLPKEEKIQSNKLINRLYKQSKSKPMKLKQQLNNQSFSHSNNSPEQKYLIPRIAKQKLKPIDDEKKSRNKIFSNHLNSSKNIVSISAREQHSSIGMSKVRSKIYSHLDQTILLQKQLERSDMKLNQKEEHEEQRQKYLTPNDFMQILKIDREMSQQFCYMNRNQGPYDWQIVQFQRRNPQDYMVISKRGLTRYFHKDVEFINFESFLSEQKIYNRLHQIFYFKIYKKHKYFQLWKKLTSVNVFKERTKQFTEKTILADNYLKELLFEVKAVCQKMQKIQTFYTQTLSSMPLEQFRLYSEKEREKTLGIIRLMEEAILKVMIEKSQVSMELFMKKMRISRDSKKIGEKKVPLLIGDESGKDMPYTQSATLRTHQMKIRNFIKLTDYMIIHSKTNLVVNMVTQLEKNLRQINQLCQQEGKILNSSWIQIQIFQDEGFIKFNPGKQNFREEMQQIVYGTLSLICQEHFQYLHLQQFQEYWQCIIQAEKTDEHIQIKSIISINPQFNLIIGGYKFEIKKAFQNIERYAKIFEPSLEFLQYMKQVEQVDYHKQNTDFFKEAMYRCKTEMQNLGEIQSQKEIGIILLKCNDYKTKIQKRCEELTLNLHSVIPQIILNRAKKILLQIQENYEKIVLTPLTVKEYIDFLKNCQQVNQFAERIGPQIMENSDLLAMTDLYSIKVPEATKNVLGDCNGQMIGLRRRLEEIEKKSNDDAEKFKKQIEKLIPTFDQRIKNHKEKLTNLDIFKNTLQIQKKIVAIKQLGSSLTTIISDKEQLQKFQQQLGLQITPFEAVDQYERFFRQVELLWDQKKIWQDFYFLNYQKALSTLELPKIRKYLQQLTKKVSIMQRELDPNQVLQDLKSKLDSFKPLFYSCQALMSPSLKEKHFAQIKSLFQKQFKQRKLPVEQEVFQDLFKQIQNPLYSLKFFQNFQINQIQSQVVSISVQALKQDELTEMIVKVQSIWKTLTIVTNPYKEGKDIILGNNDELITKIDDNLLTVNNILGSKYVGPIKGRVEVQSKMLRYMQDLIDEWYAHQRNWIYLQPILKSTFAMKNLPKQTTMFNQIDSKWKHLMKSAKDSINIKRYADEISSHFTLKLLKNNNETFELIQKTLENFLQKKRDIFQRFYFLSNDELLQILSTVKEYEQIEPHLRKVFENFVKISFDDKGIPYQMISMEDQKVILKNCIFRGEVQEWFKSAEESMKATLKSIIRLSLQKYSQIPRKQWIEKYPSQVIIVVDCIMWTSITQSYLEDLDENDITQWERTYKSQLNELVEEIRRDDLELLQRKKLVALITQDVHYRDIIQTLQTCEGLNDFTWLQQLRFYSSGETITSRQVQAELMYGYEYLGATSRLVITPLTDRCWMTITGALHIKLGANPAGPAGTGKTQSCKDLAKSLARYCIVFNCSDQINAQMMQKLFSGLAFTGSWTCLDQFNRIDIQVLSVIAQQVLTIRQALLLGKANRQLILGGKLINLNHDVGIFITMNPGYAGRTQLPDNLKTLFRPVAMMVPDYALIAQIMLFSQGFSSAKELSKK